MPSSQARNGAPLHAVCSAAARALRCTAHAWVGEGSARRECRVVFEPMTGTVKDAPPTPAAPDALVVPFALDTVGGALLLERPGGTPWSDEERELAGVFAELAARARGNGQGHVDPAVMRDPEAYFRAVFDAADAMIWVHDRDTGDFLEVNQDACDRQGYSADEFRALGPGGVAWGEPPFGPGDAARHLEIVTSTGGPHRFEWCARHRDGYPVWVEVTLRLVTLNGVERLLATGRRIDDRRAAEDALRRANEELERRVAERTAELALANQALARQAHELSLANEALEQRVAERTADLATASDSLRRSEKHFRRLIEHAHDLIVIVDVEGRALYGSPSVRAVLGYDPASLLGTPVTGLIHAEDRDRVSEWLRGLPKGAGSTHRIEFRIRHSEGEWLYLEAVSTADDSPDDTFVVNLRDVTERRRAEEDLRRTEQYYRNLIERAHDMITVVAEDGTITFQSQASEGILGYTAEEMVGTPVFQYVHPDDLELAGERMARVFGSPGTVERVVYRFRHRDGSWRHLESFGRTVLPDSAAAGVVGNVRDITDRLQAEAALQESESKYRSLIEAAQDMVTVIDADGIIRYQSPSVRAILGYEPEDMVGRSAFEFMHPEDLTTAVPLLESVMSQPGTVGTTQYRFRHRDGSWRHLETRGRTVLPDSAAAGAVALVRDITDRLQAEAAVRESEERFRTLTENAHDIIVVVDGLTGEITYQSPSMERILGYSPEEMAGRNAFELVHPDDLARVGEEMAAALAAPGTTRHAEYRYRHRDGSWRHLETYGRTRSATPGDHALVFNTRDVTERREAEMALQRSEEHFRRLIENGSDLLLISSAEGPLTYVSPSVERVLGYTPEEMLGMRPEDLLHPDDLAAVAEGMTRIVAEPGAVRGITWRIRHRDGGWRLIDALGRTLDPASPDSGIVINGRDVTEQRATEEALQRSEEHFRTLIENASDLIQISAPDGTLTYVSPSAQRLLGRDPAVLVGLKPDDLVHPDDLAGVQEAVRAMSAAPGLVREATFRMRHRDGSWRLLEAIGRTISPNGPEEGMVANARDITERREAELALQRSEEHFRTLIENGSDLLMISAADGTLTYVSPSAERMLGYTPEEMLGMRPEQMLHPDDAPVVMATLERIAAHPGTVHGFSSRMRHRDGSWRHLESLGRTVSPRGADEGIVANSRDVTEQRAAEEALRRSEEHFRALTEHSSDVATIAAPDGTILYESPAAGRVFGRHPGRDHGQIGWDDMHPDDVAGVRARLGALSRDPHRVQTARFRYHHADGSWRMLEAVARKMVPTPESPAVINTRDVTEQWHAEQALQRSEEHFRRLIENSYDLVQVLDAAGRIVYTGPSVQRLVGYSPDEMAGCTAPDFIHPDDLAAGVDLVNRVLSNPGVSGSLEYRVRHKDGSWRWMETFACTLLPDSAAEGLVANARDVTDRRAVQQALQASEEHFRRLIENGTDLLLIAGPDLALTYVSPSAEHLLGYAPSEMIGLKPEAMLHPDDMCGLADNYARVLEDPNYVTRATWRIRHRSGGWRLYEALGRLVPAQTEGYEFVINARDITDRVEAEEALRRATAEAERARAEAERANHAKSEFLSRMSHELRTPLNSILGFAQVLEDVELEAEYRTGVRHILNGGRHLLKLINEVLDIARIEADRDALSLEPVRLGTVVREAVDMVRPLAAARGVEILEVSSAASERYVHADRQRLAQVVLNLLSNAVKYNRPGGEVRIACQPCAAPGGDERLSIRVADQGAGIPAAQRDQLFIPFARLGAEHTGVEGTGLGLALSQRLAHAMGGGLTLERTGAEGSVFRVELRPAVNPLEDVAARVTEAERAVPPGQPSATLLYVEDNLANLSLVETILRSRPGWRLIPALQGRLGLELAAEHAPDVVLLDLHLPDISGREVLRHLRADPRTARIPVVVISADATSKTVEALRSEGADAFLTKPLDVKEFLATVGNHLPSPAL